MYSEETLRRLGRHGFNSHMKNTAYLDKVADVRQMFLDRERLP